MSTWEDTFMKSLKLYEQHSKCVAKKVACIITKNNNILSIGLNGTLPHSKNCCDIFRKDENGQWWYKDIKNVKLIKIKDDNDTNSHKIWSNSNEVHAEINAIKKATQDGKFDISDSIIYVSYSPCYNCAKTLALYGVKKIVFREKYDDYEKVKQFLSSHKIEIYQRKEEIKKRIPNFDDLFDD